MTQLTQRILPKTVFRSQFLLLALISLALIAIQATPAAAQSQWTTTGNNISNANSGNVGIGTSSPGQALDVNGRAVITGSKTLTGDLDSVFDVQTTVTNSGIGNSTIKVRNNFTGSGGGPTGLDIAPRFQPSANIANARGFRSGAFFAPPSGVTITDALGGTAVVVYDDVSGSVTSGTTFRLDAPLLSGTMKPTLAQHGLRIKNQGISGTPSSFGLYVDPQSGSTNSYAAIFEGGNVGIGTVAPGEKLVVSGNVSVIGTGAGNINATGTITGNNIIAKYQDVAEWVPSSEQIPAGTVVVLDSTKSNHVISSSKGYDTRVAGVVSAQPGIALGESGDSKVLVATTGRVRVRVDASHGPIQVGDLLVTSDVPGLAMKSEPVNIGGVQLHRPGTLIGKALEPLAKGSGEILVLLSLQ